MICKWTFHNAHRLGVGEGRRAYVSKTFRRLADKDDLALEEFSVVIFSSHRFGESTSQNDSGLNAAGAV
jgi:hypothetical protein